MKKYNSEIEDSLFEDVYHLVNDYVTNPRKSLEDSLRVTGLSFKGYSVDFAKALFNVFLLEIGVEKVEEDLVPDYLVDEIASIIKDFEVRQWN